MVWSEYKEEVRLLDTEPSDDDGALDDGPFCEFNEEEWQDLNSQDLLNMWMSLQEYLETFGLKRSFLQRASFNDFCEFVYKFSS